MLKPIPACQDNLTCLKRQIACTKSLLESPGLFKYDPDFFYQAREQLRNQEGLLKQAQGGGL